MRKIGIGLVLSFMLCVTAQAQADPEQLAKIPKLLKEKIGKEMPQWSHHSIEPMEGSKNVVIEQWELDDVSVKIAVTQYDSQVQAAQALKDFKSQLKIQEDATIARGKREFRLLKEDLPFLGDGGFAWDVKGSEAAAFRKNNLLVYVSIARPEHHYDLRLSKEFARHVADVLAIP